MVADHYSTLGISPDSRQEAVFGALEDLKRRLQGYAPGLDFNDEVVARLLPEKWAAFEVLADPVRRREYDDLLAVTAEVIAEPSIDNAEEQPPSRWSAFISYVAFIGMLVIGTMFLLLLAGYLL